MNLHVLPAPDSVAGALALAATAVAEAAMAVAATAVATEALVVQEATVAGVVATVGDPGQGLAVTDGEEGLEFGLGS